MLSNGTLISPSSFHRMHHRDLKVSHSADPLGRDGIGKVGEGEGDN